MTSDRHGGRKLSDANHRADSEQCVRCGKRKRADKLEPTRIGPCCRHCAAVIVDVYGEDTTL